LEDARILHWQYSEKGELPGIREKVDFNVSKITYL
jgi:GH25 family lysozyme M1 (1,4-beta-N-acetylmuramidase)